MQYESHYTNQDLMYSIGIDKESGKFCMEIIVPQVAWYSRFFEISKEEYDLKDLDLKYLDSIAKNLIRYKIPKKSERFIYSQKEEEN